MPEQNAQHFDEIWKQLGIPLLQTGWPQLDSNDPEFQARQQAFHDRRSQPRPGTIEEIAAALGDLHDFVVWAKRSAGAGTGDGHIFYLRFVLNRRCRSVVADLVGQRPPGWEKAVQLIRWVYEFPWPHNFCGYVFAQLWGWLQLELEKPGEKRPPTVAEQFKTLAEAVDKGSIPKGREIQITPFGQVLLSPDLTTDDDDDDEDEDEDEDEEHESANDD